MHKRVLNEASFYVQTAGGNQAICGFDDIIIYRDQTYKKGALAGIRTSLEWTESKGNIGLLLKVTGLDLGNPQRDAKPKLFRVDHAFIGIAGSVVQPGSSFRCEEPAAFCGSYSLPASARFGAALPQGTLAVGFNREPLGLDISFPLDSSEGIRSKPDDFRAFGDCMQNLVQRAKAKLHD
jgi:hypothetical protein